MASSQASKTFGVENIPVPAIGDDEILIKTIAASMCHSDMVYSLLDS
jgi:D-arabinose 1-dehydrogenase-like Zn-dependent alcohol dehydrogenase